jgi:hypothetical protein
MTPKEIQELRRWSAELCEYTEQFNLGDAIACKDKSGAWIQWKPDVDLNQTFMVVDKMRELGWYLKFETSPPNEYSNFAEFSNRNNKKTGYGINDIPAQAILLAAKAALESK